jgi:hypothetical protein
MDFGIRLSQAGLTVPCTACTRSHKTPISFKVTMKVLKTFETLRWRRTNRLILDHVHGLQNKFTFKKSQQSKVATVWPCSLLYLYIATECHT